MLMQTSPTKAELLKEFDRPQIVKKTLAEIESQRKKYYNIVASFSFENAEIDEFSKVTILEEIRGELTEAQTMKILGRIDSKETARIEAKVQRMHELGLSWKDL